MTDYLHDAISSLPTDVLQSMLNGARDAFEQAAPYIKPFQLRTAFYYGYVAAAIQAQEAQHSTDEWAFPTDPFGRHSNTAHAAEEWSRNERENAQEWADRHGDR